MIWLLVMGVFCGEKTSEPGFGGIFGFLDA